MADIKDKLDKVENKAYEMKGKVEGRADQIKKDNKADSSEEK